MKLTPPLIYSSTIVHGDKVGRQLGFPTANFKTAPNPADLESGVYLGQAWTKPEEKHHCLTYFGPRLIFGELHHNFEVFIYDFDGDLYDQILHVELSEFMRAPLPFTSLEALRIQLEEDKKAGQKLINIAAARAS